MRQNKERSASRAVRALAECVRQRASAFCRPFAIPYLWIAVDDSWNGHSGGPSGRSSGSGLLLLWAVAETAARGNDGTRRTRCAPPSHVADGATTALPFRACAVHLRSSSFAPPAAPQLNCKSAFGDSGTLSQHQHQYENENRDNPIGCLLALTFLAAEPSKPATFEVRLVLDTASPDSRR